MTKVVATEGLKIIKKDIINEINSEIIRFIFSCSKKTLKLVPLIFVFTPRIIKKISNKNMGLTNSS